MDKSEVCRLEDGGASEFKHEPGSFFVMVLKDIEGLAFAFLDNGREDRAKDLAQNFTKYRDALRILDNVRENDTHAPAEQGPLPELNAPSSIPEYIQLIYELAQQQSTENA